MLPHKRLRPCQKDVRHIFIYPSRFFPTFHIADARDTVHDTLVMPMVPFHLQQFGIFQASWFSLEILFIIHFNWIIRFQTYHMPILDVDRWNPILSGSHNKGLVKTHFIWSRRDMLVPIYMARTKA